MHLLVTVIGVLAVMIGLVGVVRPRALIAMVQSFGGPTRFWFAVVLRILIGIALIGVAPACTHPLAVRILGGVAIFAGLVILATGQQRLDATIAWWTASDAKVRGSALFAIAMGVLFVYVAGW